LRLASLGLPSVLVVAGDTIVVVAIGCSAAAVAACSASSKEGSAGRSEIEQVEVGGKDLGSHDLC
jgi:hypothetical protein